MIVLACPACKGTSWATASDGLGDVALVAAACAHCGYLTTSVVTVEPQNENDDAGPADDQMQLAVRAMTHHAGESWLRAKVEGLADEWEAVAAERRPHLGCFDMYRHLAGELRSALAGTRVIPPGSCGAATEHEVMRTREYLTVCPICNLDLTRVIPPAATEETP